MEVVGNLSQSVISNIICHFSHNYFWMDTEHNTTDKILQCNLSKVNLLGGQLLCSQ